MRIAIVDDLAAERTLLKGRLEWQLQRRNVQADILEYENGEIFLEAARKAPFTAAFLDIYMDGMTGMEAAKKLRKTDTDCLLVFITTSTDHALEGFQVRALHYLVKPFTEADIDALTDELLARIPQPDKYMELKVEGSEIHLRYQDIVYAEHFANSGARRGDSRHAACLLPGKIQFKAAAVKACFVACPAAYAALCRRRRAVLCAPHANCADACRPNLACSRDLHKNAPDFALEIRNDCVVRLCGICLYQQPLPGSQRRNAD